ncbi:receptor-transporting protein 3-like [Apteryx mantelli]|uniref:Receptor-transporting protein 3-like n=1 Tax=Apteryx mantelli TaxID=2696672 RepID=A0A8B7JU89_9AVES
MKTWKDIFMEKVKEMHVTEPWILQEDNTIQVNILKPGWKEFMQRRAFGRFQCSQCWHKWSSAKVHILFHMHRSRRQCQGAVRMRVFRQACRQCPDPQLEEPDFSQENMARILNNLVLKILQECYHVPVQPSDLVEVVVDAPVAGPHDSARCEGCQLGVCREPRPAQASAASTRVKKASTHRIWRGWDLTPQATQTCCPPSFSSTSLWKRYCCIGGCLLCVLAVLLFVLLYFTNK